mgnify:CR=1 FL=1
MLRLRKPYKTCYSKPTVTRNCQAKRVAPGASLTHADPAAAPGFLLLVLEVSGRYKPRYCWLHELKRYLIHSVRYYVFSSVLFSIGSA